MLKIWVAGSFFFFFYLSRSFMLFLPLIQENARYSPDTCQQNFRQIIKNRRIPFYFFLLNFYFFSKNHGKGYLIKFSTQHILSKGWALPHSQTLFGHLSSPFLWQKTSTQNFQKKIFFKAFTNNFFLGRGTGRKHAYTLFIFSETEGVHVFHIFDVWNKTATKKKNIYK